jgi:cytochrome c biogenesis protein CcmG, thiol:disulfide interchange protein DsbE
MQKKIIKLTTILLIVFILGVFFAGLNQSSFYDTKGQAGQKLTYIKLEDFNNGTLITKINLKKNNFMLINFWASWCAPCRDEHPFLIRLQDDKRLKILGVNFKDKKNNALKFLNDFGNPYDKLAKDEFGRYSINFGIYGIPESILIDSNFVILKKFIGPITDADYNDIKKIIRK